MLSYNLRFLERLVIELFAIAQDILNNTHAYFKINYKLRNESRYQIQLCSGIKFNSKLNNKIIIMGLESVSVSEDVIGDLQIVQANKKL